VEPEVLSMVTRPCAGYPRNCGFILLRDI